MACVMLVPRAMREQAIAVLVLVLGAAVESVLPQPPCITEIVRPALAVEPTGGVWVQCAVDEPELETSGR